MSVPDRAKFEVYTKIYCGARPNRFGIVRDVYGDQIRVIVYSPYALWANAIDKLSQLCREVEERREEWARHARLCSAPDCVRYREWRMFEYNRELLERLGVKYEYYESRCVGAIPEKVENLPTLLPMEVILAECEKRRQHEYGNIDVLAYLFGYR